MLSAIEIYNKPNFQYREETFSILAVNAWELLLKAYLLRLNKYNVKSIYVYEQAKKKDGSYSKRQQIKLNRCNKPYTISIFEAMNRLMSMGEFDINLKNNIDSVIDLRDNAVHFTNINQISKTLQELGFACVKNYMTFIKAKSINIDLSKYNFYLMPLAYVNSSNIIDSTILSESQDFINIIKNRLSNQDDNSKYDIAVKIKIDFNKGNSIDAIKVRNAANPDILVNYSEEDFSIRFPWTYNDVICKCKERYVDFKQGKVFNTIMKSIKNSSLCHTRRLDNKNPKSAKKDFYSSTILSELDKHYKKK